MKKVLPLKGLPLRNKHKSKQSLKTNTKATEDYEPDSTYFQNYHPRVSTAQIQRIVQQVKDWQICNGQLLKLIEHEKKHTSLTYPVGVTLLPSPFPRSLFDHACALQPLYNELYMAVAQDPAWLEHVLEDLIATDPLTSILWSIYCKAVDTGVASTHAMGIFRSDYMLHKNDDQSLVLKQVEFNTISCAGMVHGQKTQTLHKYLDTVGSYGSATHPDPDRRPIPLNIPTSSNQSAIVSAIDHAFRQYGKARYADAIGTCVLMVVQGNNFNIADERPIEYALWSRSHPVPTFRVEWSSTLLANTNLAADKTLRYHDPAGHGYYEVAVVYYRAGFELHEYEDNPAGIDIRLRLETSAAIKCPSILSHLTTFKKVQQALAAPNGVEHFLEAELAAQVRKTFMPMYPLDGSEQGLMGRKIVADSDTIKQYVLKPSLEGGGHNLYREQIPEFMRTVAGEEWGRFILMKLIQPPQCSNILVTARGVQPCSTVSELGVLGTCLWQTYKQRPGKPPKILRNRHAGWSVRTKNANVDEMSVVKDYGCFDSLNLVETNAYHDLHSATLYEPSRTSGDFSD